MIGMPVGRPRMPSSVEPMSEECGIFFDGWRIDPETGYRMRGKA